MTDPPTDPETGPPTDPGTGSARQPAQSATIVVLCADEGAMSRPPALAGLEAGADVRYATAATL
ncbi:MAG: hypothetical protein ACRDPT_12020, partial [Streptomycetales bacterium]